MKTKKLEISLEDLRLNNDGAYFLYQASGWAKFLAIVGLVAYGLLLLMMLIGTIMLSGAEYASYTQSMNMGYDPGMIFSWGFFIFFLIIIGVMCIPLVYLYNF